MAKSSFTPKRKLSSAIIMGGDVRVIWRTAYKANPNLDRIPLYKIAGKAVRWETKDSQYGESVCLIGDFMAVNANTGEVMKSNRVYLPGIMTDSVLAHIGDGKFVEFAFDVAIIPDPNVKSATGYQYTFDTLIEVAEDSEMSKFEVALGIAPAAKMLEGNSPEVNRQKKLTLAK